MYLAPYKISFLFQSIFILTCNLVFAQIEKPFKNDWIRDELKGRVKQIDHYTAKKLQKRITYNSSGFQTSNQAYSQSVPQKVVLSSESFYDEKGNLLKNVGADFTMVNKYDQQGNLIEIRYLFTGNKKTSSLQTFEFRGNQITRSKQTNFYFNSDEIDFTHEVEYQYDQKNLLLEEIEILTRAKKPILTKKVFYAYDELARKTSRTEFNGRGDTTSRVEYDSLGRIIARHARFPNKIEKTSTLGYDEYYKYDEKGNRVQISNFNTAGMLLYKDDYHFDANGNCITRIHFFKDKPTAENRYTYDSKGWLTQELTYADGELTKRILYERDDHENIIRRIHFDGKGECHLNCVRF